MGSEHLNWVFENVNKFILKEETKTDLPSWKTDINNDFGLDLLEFEDGILLSPLVRLTYLRYLRNSLKNNYLQCQKGFKDCSDRIVRRIENCASLMEKKALRLSMIASYYQRTMNSIITDIKSLTNNNLLHKELGRCLCSDYFSSQEDKNIQVDIHPLRFGRGVQTSDHRPWTETDLDTFESQRITNSHRRSSRDSHLQSPVNKVPESKSHIASVKVAHTGGLSQDFSYVNDLDQAKNSVPSLSRGHNFSRKPTINSDLSKNSDGKSYHSNNRRSFSSIEPSDLNYDSKKQGIIVEKIVHDYASSFSENDDDSLVAQKRKAESDRCLSNKFFKGEGFSKNESVVSEVNESKDYDSLDHRLQELFADQPSDISDQPENMENHHKPLEEIMKDLMGSDDDDFPLDSQEIEEINRDLSDNELDIKSSTTPSSVGYEDSLMEAKKLRRTPEISEISPRNDKSLLDPNLRIKSHCTPWLSERVAQVCYFNSLLERMRPAKRKELEKKCVSLFGPCCMFDNDDLTQEEQKIVCRKRIAKIVCNQLRPFFKTKKIESKEAFRNIARHITEQLLSKHLAADEELVEKCVYKFLKKNGKIKNSEQLPFNVKPKIEVYDDA